MIFDTHSHYDDEAFNEDRNEVLCGLADNNVEMVVNVAAEMSSVKTTIDLADKYDFVYAAVGIHPDSVGQLNDETFEWLKEQALKPKVVSIGEIGLDYHWMIETKENQIKWFERQLAYANEIKKPVIIHSRDAAKDTVDIIQSEEGKASRGVVHCYSYSLEMAKEILKQDYVFGVGGVVTFKNAKKLVETVEYLPMDRIVLETDCPYLAPTPYRGERNTSAYISYVAQRIAQIKGITCEEVIEVTNKNAKKLYFNEG